MDIDIKKAIMMIIGAVVIFYIIGYTVPGAASVLSNSTGLWPGASGTGVSYRAPGVFALASIVVPLVLMAGIMLWFFHHAED